VDVYPVTATQPYRLDFFGDELEDIRGFDPLTQRSDASIESIRLAASPRVRLEPAKAGIADYLPAGAQLILVEPASVEESFGAMQPDGTNGLAPLLHHCARVWGVADLDEASAVFDAGAAEATWDTESLAHHRRYPGEGLVAQERLQVEEEGRNEFLGQVKQWAQAGYEVIFVAAKEGEEQRMREILAEDPALAETKPRFLRGGINEGFRCARPRSESSAAVPAELRWLPPKAQGLVLVTETEVFGRQRPRRTSGPVRALVQRAQVDQLLDFSELVEGDFVVHLQHGIALFRGLSKLDTAAGLKEVISLEFDQGVTLHVPLSESHLISRYVGLSKSRPQLGRIGSGRWEKARQAAERSTLDLAAELLQLQASREAQPGHAFPADTTWQKEF
jgi:transcription-repair coupling factor (superfamily II helicase)